MNGGDSMGSRVMHAVIAYEVSLQLNVEDSSLFILGGIAPDSVSDKKLSHFFKGDVKSYDRSGDFSGFLEKYGDLNDDYIMGYFTHIVADDLWLSTFYLPWLRYYMADDESYQHRYYKDFESFNGILNERYPQLKKIVGEIKVPTDLQEVSIISKEGLEELLKDIVNDLEDNHIEELDIFKYDQIVSYLKTAVEKSVYLIKEYEAGRL